MTYSDKHGEFFGRINENGDVAVFHESGEAATRMDCNLFVVDSDGSEGVRYAKLDARYEHPDGIVITRADAAKIGLEIEIE